MTRASPYLCWPVPRSLSPFLQWFEDLFGISPCACLIMDLKIKLGILIFLNSALKSLLLNKQEARTDQNYIWWISQKSLKFQILPAHNNPLKSYQFLVNICWYDVRRGQSVQGFIYNLVSNGLRNLATGVLPLTMWFFCASYILWDVFFFSLPTAFLVIEKIKNKTTFPRALVGAISYKGVSFPKLRARDVRSCACVGQTKKMNK